MVFFMKQKDIKTGGDIFLYLQTKKADSHKCHMTQVYPGWKWQSIKINYPSLHRFDVRTFTYVVLLDSLYMYCIG